MLFEIVHLNDIYPCLNNNGADPTLEIMVQDTVIKDRPRPSILVCPGGGYCDTWSGEGQNVGLSFMTLGLNAFVLRYSCKPHTYPQQLSEVACAVDYIVSNSERFNCDPEKTAILGFSAGGHLAASYCTMRDRKEVTDIVGEAKPVAAAVLCYPVISAEQPTHLGSFQALTGKECLTDEEVYKYSAEKHVRKGLTPPTYIWTTAEDSAVDPVNTLKYATALSNNRIPFELHVFPKGGHGMSTASYGISQDPKSSVAEYVKVWTAEAGKWLRTVFDI